MKQFDIAIIGSGAVGNAIARELSRYKLSVCVIEKEYDVAFGTSGRNSGVLHAGFNNRPGTLMAKLCVEGSQGFEKEAKSLLVDFNKTGKLVTALYEEDIPKLKKLKAQGEANGTKGLSIISEKEIKAINPKISGVAALWSKETGVFDPFQYTIALAEEAAINGVQFFFDFEVDKIENITVDDNQNAFFIYPKKKTQAPIKSKVIINSAGLHSDEICKLVGIDDYHINPCRGEYHILDKKVSQELKLPVYPVPNEKAGGLGVHLTYTMHGNLMIGPSAEYLEERDDYSSTNDVMEELFVQGRELFPYIERNNIIRSFTGIRPKLTTKEQGGYADFVIKESEKVPGFIILTGIESPGLTASIPIARMVLGIVKNIMDIELKENYKKRCEWGLPKNNESQRIICRCESKTENDILNAYDAIKWLGAKPTLKGIKNRTRVGMGNCQGSFCTVNIIELLLEKRLVNPLEFSNHGDDSSLFVGRIR